MAKVNQTVCDRCGRNADDVPNDLPKRLIRFDKDYHGTQIDLCENCATQFKTWLADQTGPPPGYKFQARPCPHHVPCADPTGCSGQELVPI